MGCFDLLVLSCFRALRRKAKRTAVEETVETETERVDKEAEECQVSSFEALAEFSHSEVEICREALPDCPCQVSMASSVNLLSLGYGPDLVDSDDEDFGDGTGPEMNLDQLALFLICRLLLTILVIFMALLYSPRMSALLHHNWPLSLPLDPFYKQVLLFVVLPVLIMCGLRWTCRWM